LLRKFGHWMRLAPNTICPSVLVQGVVVFNLESLRVSQDVRHEPAKCRLLAHFAQRQFQGIEAPLVFNAVSSFREAMVDAIRALSGLFGQGP
jgi:hypothetical protein